MRSQDFDFERYPAPSRREVLVAKRPFGVRHSKPRKHQSPSVDPSRKGSARNNSTMVRNTADQGLFRADIESITLPRLDRRIQYPHPLQFTDRTLRGCLARMLLGRRHKIRGEIGRHHPMNHTPPATGRTQPTLGSPLGRTGAELRSSLAEVSPPKP